MCWNIIRTLLAYSSKYNNLLIALGRKYYRVVCALRSHRGRKLCEFSASCTQMLWRALLHNAATFHDDDAVAVRDISQAIRVRDGAEYPQTGARS